MSWFTRSFWLWCKQGLRKCFLSVWRHIDPPSAEYWGQFEYVSPCRSIVVTPVATFVSNAPFSPCRRADYTMDDPSGDHDGYPRPAGLLIKTGARFLLRKSRAWTPYTG
jgi:hypothetical protein